VSRTADEQAIIERLRRAAKYRDIHIDTIVDLVRQERAKALNSQDLERRTRLKLHKVAAGYLLTGRTRHLLRGLQQSDASDDARREYCRGVLAAHFSSAERLPDLDRFYPAVFDAIGPVGSVADLACALNPFSMPWLRDVTDAEYIGYDLNLAYIELGKAFLDGRYERWSLVHSDVLVTPAGVTADVALLLKTYHCIEDRVPGAGLRLVGALGSPIVVTSFPLRTMTGRPAAFTERLVAGLVESAARQSWDVQQRELSTELLVFVRKDGADGAPS
jgi:16S rRNA (guanine(1405)-N(7))-methyltransferase